MPFLLRPYKSRSEGKTTEILSSPVRQALGCLRRAAMHYFSFEEEEWDTEKRLTAAEELFKYAKLCENDLGSSFCTINLHILICRLGMQEDVRGLVSQYFEGWLERLIGFMKQNLKHRTTSDPERCVVSDIQTDEALYRANASFPGRLDELLKVGSLC